MRKPPANGFPASVFWTLQIVSKIGPVDSMCWYRFEVETGVTGLSLEGYGGGTGAKPQQVTALSLAEWNFRPAQTSAPRAARSCCSWSAGPFTAFTLTLASLRLGASGR
jgi:hypothetical protein